MSRKAFRFHSRREEEKEDDKGKGSISDDYVQKNVGIFLFLLLRGREELQKWRCVFETSDVSTSVFKPCDI